MEYKDNITNHYEKQDQQCALVCKKVFWQLPVKLDNERLVQVMYNQVSVTRNWNVWSSLYPHCYRSSVPIDEVTFVIILPGGMRTQPVPFRDHAFKIPTTLG